MILACLFIQSNNLSKKVASLISHSQMMQVLILDFFNLRITFLSLEIFPFILVNQKSVFVLGVTKYLQFS